MAKTGILAALLTPKPKGAPSKEAGAAGSGGGSAKADLLRDLFEAAQAKDWDGAALAFDELYEACSGGASDEGEDDEYDPDLADDDEE